ncbi:MAG: glycosyltransferase, partial [Tepidisphaeraceae bacterium]
MPDDAIPTFSIVVPTYNRPRELRACLAALGRLNYPPDRFEVIVADDGSAQPMEIAVGHVPGLRVRFVRQRNGGPAKARNSGAAVASGEFLAFTDDDCAPDPLWLRALAARLTRRPDICVGGSTVNALRDNPYSTTSQVLVSYLYRYYNAAPDHSRFITTNNMAVRAGAFAEVGGFDTTYPHAAAEDREFCDRWIHLGRALVYEPAALVWHSHDLTLWSFVRQHFHYGSGARRFHQVRARRTSQPIAIEPMSFYTNLVGAAFVEETGWRAARMAALLALTQAIGAVGYFYQRLG